MSVRLLLDMNASSEWIAVLAPRGYSAIHWSAIGDPRAEDSEIMDWASANGFVVFTHDLDFGTLLALTRATGPSVIQIRGRDVLPNDIGVQVLAALHRYDADLVAGALVVIDTRKARTRVRVLPF